MAKRFTDTEIWDKEWYMTLRPALKCLVRYIFDKCDQAGIWCPNWHLASFMIGENVAWSDISDLGVFEMLPNGKIFVQRFTKFQYGDLKPASPPHRKVIDILSTNGVLDRVGHTPSEGVTLPRVPPDGHPDFEDVVEAEPAPAEILPDNFLHKKVKKQGVSNTLSEGVWHTPQEKEEEKEEEEDKEKEEEKEKEKKGGYGGKIARENSRSAWRAEIEEVVGELNALAGRAFDPTSALTVKLVTARLAEYPLEDLIDVVRLKVRQWKADPKMSQYLQPSTLFAATNCAKYVEEMRQYRDHGVKLRVNGKRDPREQAREVMADFVNGTYQSIYK